MPKFQDSPHKEEAMQALRNGASPEEAAARFGITVRTAWRYLNEIKEGKPIKHSRLPRTANESNSSSSGITISIVITFPQAKG